MDLESLLIKLEGGGKIKKQLTDDKYLNASLNAAAQNFSAAKHALSGGYSETAFKSAYDGLLQISRVVMLLNGYRPDDGKQHKTTFLVAGAMLGDDFMGLIDKINSFRVKRNNIIYQPLIAVTRVEAEGILKSAEEFWNKVKIYLKNNSKQLTLFDF